MSVLEIFTSNTESLQWLILLLLVSILAPSLLSRTSASRVPRSGKIAWVGAAIYGTVTLLGWTWLSLVNAHVPEPYLDEFFHIPQAQKFCEDRWSEWDDKITTPPGLYLVSKYVLKTHFSKGCSALNLRSVNILATVCVGILATFCRHRIEARLNDAHSAAPLRTLSVYAVHTGLNICLFPVLFFFSGLYYTDIVSTLAVLLSYHHHLRRIGTDKSSLGSDVWTVVLGIIALFMRQTNVFWVVVYMGGLEAVYAIKSLCPESVDQPEMTTLIQVIKYFSRRYSVGDVHDPPLNLAWPDDFLFCALSMAVAAVCHPVRILRQIWPYIAIMGSFAGFVAWNGGVVLGDKSNHVATMHLAQMLYIWPLFAFFSGPLFLSYCIGPLRFFVVLFREVFFKRATTSPSSSTITSETNSQPQLSGSSKSRSSGSFRKSSKSTKPSSRQQDPPKQSAALRYLTLIFAQRLYYPFLILATTGLSFLIVKYNTIIHPFTLADNRHYMFYVFRKTIRRPGWFRYYLILPYTVCRYFCLGTLEGCTVWIVSTWVKDCSAYYSFMSRDAPYISHPFAYAPQKRQTRTKKISLCEGPATENSEYSLVKLDDPTSTATEPASSSTSILFLLATTLSLITAPLVEPRYFILPWVFWRLLVPAWRTHEHRIFEPHTLEHIRGLGLIFRVGKQFDVRLILETVWFLAINVITMYIFLFKPYQWRAEDGTVLDDGRLQRFMW